MKSKDLSQPFQEGQKLYWLLNTEAPIWLWQISSGVFLSGEVYSVDSIVSPDTIFYTSLEAVEALVCERWRIIKDLYLGEIARYEERIAVEGSWVEDLLAAVEGLKSTQEEP